MPRELVDTGRDNCFVRRDETGQCDDVVDVGQSLAADRCTKAKRTVKPGEGDRGDPKPRKKTVKAGGPQAADGAEDGDQGPLEHESAAAEQGEGGGR